MIVCLCVIISSLFREFWNLPGGIQLQFAEFKVPKSGEIHVGNSEDSVPNKEVDFLDSSEIGREQKEEENSKAGASMKKRWVLLNATADIATGDF